MVFRPKRTSSYVAFDVALGGKADMSCALRMSAFDPKRTLDLSPTPLVGRLQ